MSEQGLADTWSHGLLRQETVQDTGDHRVACVCAVHLLVREAKVMQESGRFQMTIRFGGRQDAMAELICLMLYQVALTGCGVQLTTSMIGRH